jgi:DNA-directed RNA polymerase II subunit RPB7
VGFSSLDQSEMFFHILLEKNISLHPKHFSGELKETLLEKLVRQEEGQTSVRFGYVVSITKIVHVGKGKINESGFATFTIKFEAIVFKPFKNEVLDANVTSVSKVGFFASVGTFVIFVSRHQMDEDMKFEPDSTPPCYVSSENPSAKIEPGRDVRLRIMGIQVDGSQLFGTATIKQDYLGPI